MQRAGFLTLCWTRRPPSLSAMMSLLPLLVEVLCATMLAPVATTIDNGLGRTPP